jgi:predicted NAD-dependent protein-ADP-ribosyltransferase YbiA (DUF1768 family)
MAQATPPEIPYDEKTAADIKNFYKKQKTKPDLYKVADDGKLQIFNAKDGVLASTIELKVFRPITAEERETQEQDRLDKLATLDILYENAKGNLRQALANYRDTGQIVPVLEANKEVEDIELRRVNVRSAVRSIKVIPNPVTSQVLFDEPYETRKLFGAHNLFGSKKDELSKGIYSLLRRDFPIHINYGRYEEPSAEAVAAAKAVAVNALETTVSVKLANGVTARLFYETDDVNNGFLSPLWPANFIYKETEYSSAYQAYQVERMREKAKDDIAKSLLGTRSTRTIRLLTRKILGAVANPQATLSGILEALYQQHPELADRLVRTGTDSLVYADADVGVGGVGRGASDRKVLDPAQWQSDNVVGKVLETIRAQIREAGGALEEVPVEEANEAVISEEEQASAKKAAIINARRA